MNTAEVVKNAMLGIAVGDALGSPVEFKYKYENISAGEERSRFLKDPVTTMLPRFGQERDYIKPPGTFTDDTSMTLATADSIAKKGIDYDDMMKRFLAWLHNDDYTTDGRFGAGGTTKAALKKYADGTPALQSGMSESTANGNGSIMRIFPAAIYNIKLNDLKNKQVMDNIGALTHAHPISIISCGIYGKVLQSIMDKNTRPQDLSEAVKSALAYYAEQYPGHIHHFERLTNPRFLNTKEHDISSGGYVLDTLESALWCYLNTDNFKDCAVKAVNLGGDSDSTASVAGGLAAITYGAKSIPDEWMEILRGKEMINEISENFSKKLEEIGK